MSLSPGTALGPYRIVTSLGAGGMGEVYRAHDARLGRDVAIKVLSPHLAATPEVRARFEREARTISQLSHPHICALYDIGRQGEVDYLVMELLDGETLAHRLEKGPLPVSEVLSLGVQIADALDKAHRAGIVHRDLKPGNIMLAQGGAKLMDFGLARASSLVPAADTLSASPTVSRPLTAEGTVVGTFQYMAPEQLEGKEADARTDIWALGCVLYEMVTGQRAFVAKSQASLIAAVMGTEPPAIVELQPLTPPALEHAVRGCLAKDPGERWQSAHDVARELEWIRSAASQAGTAGLVASRRRSRGRIAWALAIAGLIAVAGLGRVVFESRTGEPQLIQAIVDTAEGSRLSPLGFYRADLVISPDGQNLAFVAADSSGGFSLRIRPLGAETEREVPDTRNAWCPFWSPDGQYVAFFDIQAMKLKKVPIAGGRPATLCDAGNGRGGSWNREGVIVFAPSTEGPLLQVTSGGGAPVAATALDSSRHESAHRFPCFLPDGDHFLFSVLPGSPNGWEICVGSLRSRDVQRLLTSSSAAVYAEPGYLLYERDGRVMAQRFDARRLEIEGDPVAIADAPQRSEMEADPVVSASRNGILALIRGAPSNTRLAMLDRTGAARTSYNLPPGPWQVLAAAPDAGRAAVMNGTDLWILDLGRSVPTRFVTVSAQFAVWSPDGRRIAYVSMDEGREEIHVASLDGRVETVPTTHDAYKQVYDWTRDGRYIVFGSFNPAGNMDLWLLPLEGDQKPRPYLRDPWWERSARVSPDGRWLAYSSIETGQPEVYVQSFPHPGRKVRVSLHGGDYPMWSKGGKELLYSEGNAMIAVAVEGDMELRPGSPRRLFSLSGYTTGLDVIAKGDGFLVSTATEIRPRDIRIIINWRALTKR